MSKPIYEINAKLRYEISYKYFDSTDKTWLGVCSLTMTLTSMEEALNIALQYKKLIQFEIGTTKVTFNISEN